MSLKVQKNVPSPLPGYPALLADIKQRVSSAQARAVRSVNTELIKLYWEIGAIIDSRQKKAGWGAEVILRLARDLHNELPEEKGFSERNINRMLAFYREYPHAGLLTQTETDVVSGPKGQQLMSLFPPELLWSLPWGHHDELITKVKDLSVRQWYMQAVVSNGWGRNVLAVQIKSDAHKRLGSAATSNFDECLPPPDSDLAQQVVKDPYVLDFMSLGQDFRERELETGLVKHLERFLLELGQGFAFVGRQYHLNIGDKDFYIDLLFFHINLGCYVVIELKRGEFKPEYAGKINFYCNAVDDKLRQANHKPTIGLVLCQERNQILAEYALRNVGSPISVSSYELELTRTLPESLQGSLPSVESIVEKMGENGSRN